MPVYSFFISVLDVIRAEYDLLPGTKEIIITSTKKHGKNRFFCLIKTMSALGYKK
jgi:hypothetical protein